MSELSIFSAAYDTCPRHCAAKSGMNMWCLFRCSCKFSEPFYKRFPSLTCDFGTVLNYPLFIFFSFTSTFFVSVWYGLMIRSLDRWTDSNASRSFAKRIWTTWVLWVTWIYNLGKEIMQDTSPFWLWRKHLYDRIELTGTGSSLAGSEQYDSAHPHLNESSH